MSHLYPGYTFTDVIPTSGTNVTIIPVVPGAVHVLVMSPAATLLTLTLTMPTTGVNGQRIEITTSQTITTLTMAGGSILGALTTLLANGYAAYRFRASNSTWYRVG